MYTNILTIKLIVNIEFNTPTSKKSDLIIELLKALLIKIFPIPKKTESIEISPKSLGVKILAKTIENRTVTKLVKTV
jgi:hypothetical protein